MSQRDLARRLCILASNPAAKQETISRWERGERIPGDYWQPYLAVALKLPLERVILAAYTAKQQRIAEAARQDRRRER